MSSFTLDVPDLVATESLGRALGPLLFPGSVIALVGRLGAGKTHFTRAVADGLQIRGASAVTSPTFVLIQEYPARLPIYHFDAYRLRGEEEFAGLGADEYLYGDGVCLVEWADRVPAALPAERLDVSIEILGESRRRFGVAGRGRRYEELATAWRAALTCPSTS